jgi:hypothetical protein
MALLIGAARIMGGQGLAQEATSDVKDPLASAFDKLKSLVGEWEAATATAEAPRGQVIVRYRLTGGGSALTETILPGSTIEMLSVYHRDGAQLLLTHYCCAGNQPRMRARLGPNPDEIVFEFAGGTNLNAEKDGHIHGGRLRFEGADRVHAEWDYYVGGKPADKHVFDLIRKK